MHTKRVSIQVHIHTHTEIFAIATAVSGEPYNASLEHDEQHAMFTYKDAQNTSMST